MIGFSLTLQAVFPYIKARRQVKAEELANVKVEEPAMYYS